MTTGDELNELQESWLKATDALRETVTELATVRKRLADVEAERDAAVKWTRNHGWYRFKDKPICHGCGVWLVYEECGHHDDKQHKADCPWVAIVGRDWAAKHSTGTESL